jgi:hypothetical protein
MYTADNSEAVSAAIKTAECKENKIYCDRKQYTGFYEIVEKYIHDNDLYIDGNIGIKLLLYQQLSLKDIQYIIISKNPETDAYNMADLIYESDKTGLGQYTYVSTKIANMQYSIWVNQRELFVIKSFGIVKEVEIFDILRPIARPAFYAKDTIPNNGPARRGDTIPDNGSASRENNGSASSGDIGMINVNIYSTDLQLINIYNKLTNTTLVSEYPDLISYESQISKQFLTCHTSSEKHGSGHHNGSNKAISDKVVCNINTKQIIESLLSKFVPSHGHVLVGSYGIAALKNNISIDKLRYSENCRLQIITSNPFSEEKKAIIELVNKLNCRTFGIINDPSIPTDGQLRKLTFYVDRKNGQREVLIDIFNSGTYQLIPHYNHIGTVFVIMKYILVDFWTLQLLYKMEYNKAHTTLVQLSNLIKQYKSTQYIYDDIVSRKQYEKLFPTDHSSYVGYYLDEGVQAKRSMMGVKTGPGKTYYPCELSTV